MNTAKFYSPKDKYSRGQAVGLSANIFCGTVEKIEWSEKFNQNLYTLYPYSEGDKRKATENVLIAIEEWICEKFTIEELKKIDDHLKNNYNSNITSTIILTKWKALMSGRVRYVYDVIVAMKEILR